jgi:hypothetical protein
MNAPAFTPGPWRASIGALVRVVARRSTICGVHRSGRFAGLHDPQETEANAHLIAAAPDYDAAASRYVQWIEGTGDGDIPQHLRDTMETTFGAQLRVALAKARGADVANEDWQSKETP